MRVLLRSQRVSGRKRFPTVKCRAVGIPHHRHPHPAALLERRPGGAAAVLVGPPEGERAGDDAPGNRTSTASRNRNPGSVATAIHRWQQKTLTTMNVRDSFFAVTTREVHLMKHPLNLGKAEMDVLRYVAEHAPVTVREVADHLAQTKGQVRTTVLNSMERLRRKGFLRRRKAAGVYRYESAESKGQLFQRLLKGFVEAAFGGSAAPMVAYFAEHGKMTEAEMKMLQEVARRLEASKK